MADFIVNACRASPMLSTPLHSVRRRFGSGYPHPPSYSCAPPFVELLASAIHSNWNGFRRRYPHAIAASDTQRFDPDRLWLSTCATAGLATFSSGHGTFESRHSPETGQMSPVRIYLTKSRFDADVDGGSRNSVRISSLASRRVFRHDDLFSFTSSTRSPDPAILQTQRAAHQRHGSPPAAHNPDESQSRDCAYPKVLTAVRIYT